jgi:branched-chain amino acid transport system substrate-binding protein
VYFTVAKLEHGRLYGEFAAAYRARFGHEPGPSAAEGYDAAVILLEAARRTAQREQGQVKVDRRALLTAVTKTDLDGYSGRIRFRDNGDRRAGAAVTVYRVQDGHTVEQGVIRPD